MPIGKYVRLGGAIHTIIGEYTKTGGVIKTGLINAFRLGGVIEQVSVADRQVYVCEQVSDRLYSVTGDLVLSAGWPVYGQSILQFTGGVIEIHGSDVIEGHLSGHQATVVDVLLVGGSWTDPGDPAWGTLTVSGATGTFTDNEELEVGGVMHAIAHGTIAPAFTDPVDVACDSSGNSYWACASTLIKLDKDGAVQWTFVHEAATIKSVCVDASGNVYFGDFAGTVKKLSSAGAELWSKTPAASYAFYALAVDNSAGYVYGVTGFGGYRLYRFLCSNGNYSQITLASSYDLTAVAVDWADGDLLVGDVNGTIRRVTTGGYVEQTSPNAGSDIHTLSVGADGYGYCAMGASRYARKFVAATLAPVWSYRPATGTACCNGVTVDLTSTVFATYQTVGSSAENLVRKIDSAGALLDTYSPYTTAQMFGIAARPGIKAAGF